MLLSSDVIFWGEVLISQPAEQTKEIRQQYKYIYFFRMYFRVRFLARVFCLFIEYLETTTIWKKKEKLKRGYWIIFVNVCLCGVFCCCSRVKDEKLIRTNMSWMSESLCVCVYSFYVVVACLNISFRYSVIVYIIFIFIYILVLPSCCIVVCMFSLFYPFFLLCCCATGVLCLQNESLIRSFTKKTINFVSPPQGTQY